MIGNLALFYITIATLASCTMCWFCEQKFQATNIPEEEQYWVKLRNTWFICEVGGILTLTCNLILTLM